MIASGGEKGAKRRMEENLENSVVFSVDSGEVSESAINCHPFNNSILP